VKTATIGKTFTCHDALGLTILEYNITPEIMEFYHIRKQTGNFFLSNTKQSQYAFSSRKRLPAVMKGE